MDAAYETFLYDNFPFSDTHPDWTGFIGHLFGMSPARAERCRVLELGCGLGGNLVPFAALFPDSEFVGIDLAEAQIERARADAAALGLGNLRFEVMDICDVPADWGAFDYIICHGVYTWVPPPVQARIMEILRDHLAPQGIGYVSYNTLPGWHARGMFRDILKRVVPQDQPPEVRADMARQFLTFIADTAPEHGPLTGWVRNELKTILKLSDRYLFFEFLVDDNRPCYFEDFMRTAHAHGLQYLGDGEIQSMNPRKLGPNASESIAHWTDDPLHTEQLMDFASARFFRRTLLCRGDVPLFQDIAPERLLGCWFSAQFEPNADDTPVADGLEAAFTMPDGYVVSSTDSVLKAILLALSAHRPGGLTLDALLLAVCERLGTPPDEALRARIARSLLEMLVAGRLEAGRWARPIAHAVAERPTAAPWLPLQASQGRDGCTNLHHASITIDKLDRVLLQVMDGTRDLDALTAEAWAALQDGRVNITIDDAPLQDRQTMRDLVELKLRHLVRKSFVLAG